MTVDFELSVPVSQQYVTRLEAAFAEFLLTWKGRPEGCRIEVFGAHQVRGWGGGAGHVSLECPVARTSVFPLK